MKIRKNVTAKVLEANRANAQRSTGPRTRRGQANAKHNALKFGIFCETVVVERCDGSGAEEKYRLFVKEVWREWKPAGVHENWLVQQLADIQWKFRRAGLAEAGYSVQQQERSELLSQQLTQMESLKRLLSSVTSAQEELQAVGTLSDELYQKLLPITQDQKSLSTATADENGHSRYRVQDAFKIQLNDLKAGLEAHIRQFEEQWAQRTCDPQPREALPKVEHMDQVLRYERHQQRRMDWVLRELRRSQEQRARASAGPRDLDPRHKLCS